QLAQIPFGQVVELTWIKRFEVLVERIDDDIERKLSLELRRAAMQRKAAAALRLTDELEHKPGLADPGLTCDEEKAWITRTYLLQQLPEQLQLAGSADEGLGQYGHDKARFPVGSLPTRPAFGRFLNQGVA